MTALARRLGFAVLLCASTAAGGRLAPQQWKVGAGKPTATVVYLHGLGGAPRDGVGDRLLEEMGKRGASLQVIAPWLRPVRLGGVDEHGVQRVESDGPHTMSYQAEQAREVIRAQPGKVLLMGHSFGGKLVLKLAHEAEFRDKIIAGVTLAPSVDMLYAYWKRLTGEKGLPTPQLVAARLDVHAQYLNGALRDAQRQGNRDAVEALSGELDYHAVMSDLVRHDEPGMQRGIQMPLLHLHGTDDGAVSIHYARRFAQANPGVKLVEYPGLDHGFRADKRPEVTAHAIGDMADRVNAFVRENKGR